MKSNRLILMLLSLIASSSLCFAAEGEEGQIEVVVKNNFVSPRLLQVRDDLCPIYKKEACSEAEIKLESRECREAKTSERCREADERLKRGDCIAGLVYEGRLAEGETLAVSVCNSPAGYGTVSIRTIDLPSPWVQHRLVGEGDTVKYP